MAKSSKVVLWAATPHGYGVQVIDGGGEIIDDYIAGNSPWESQGYLPPDHPHAVPLKTLRRYAEQSAHDMADEYDSAVVDECEDLESDLLERFTYHD